MGRPRGFDEGAVLDAAARQFRVHGFADTSTEQLCGAAGVRRSSLYNTFVSKDELFRRALERQLARASAQQEAVLTDDRLSGRERLATLFGHVLDEEREARQSGHAAGCMVVATRMAPAIGARDPQAQRLLDRYLDDQLALVATAVEAGRLDGSLRADTPAHEAALMIVSAISGMRVLAQSGTPVAALHTVATLHLASLET